MTCLGDVERMAALTSMNRPWVLLFLWYCIVNVTTALWNYFQTVKQDNTKMKLNTIWHSYENEDGTINDCFQGSLRSRTKCLDPSTSTTIRWPGSRKSRPWGCGRMCGQWRRIIAESSLISSMLKLMELDRFGTMIKISINIHRKLNTIQRYALALCISSFETHMLNSTGNNWQEKNLNDDPSKN